MVAGWDAYRVSVGSERHRSQRVGSIQGTPVAFHDRRRGDVIQVAEAAYGFEWAPSGDRIALGALAPEPTPNRLLWSTEIWVAVADGSAKERIGEGI